ncbi:unnamed protein product, partial [Heterotrigona itama]
MVETDSFYEDKKRNIFSQKIPLSDDKFSQRWKTRGTNEEKIEKIRGKILEMLADCDAKEDIRIAGTFSDILNRHDAIAKSDLYDPTFEEILAAPMLNLANNDPRS